jgi:uncharacterized membrane protein
MMWAVALSAQERVLGYFFVLSTTTRRTGFAFFGFLGIITSLKVTVTDVGVRVFVICILGVPKDNKG